jgi:hypothetical protein
MRAPLVPARRQGSVQSWVDQPSSCRHCQKCLQAEGQLASHATAASRGCGRVGSSREPLRRCAHTRQTRRSCRSAPRGWPAARRGRWRRPTSPCGAVGGKGRGAGVADTHRQPPWWPSKQGGRARRRQAESPSALPPPPNPTCCPGMAGCGPAAPAAPPSRPPGRCASRPARASADRWPARRPALQRSGTGCGRGSRAAARRRGSGQQLRQHTPGGGRC